MESLTDLHPDIIRYISYMLDDESLNNLILALEGQGVYTPCRESQEGLYTEKIFNEVFWLNKIMSQYHLTPDEIDRATLIKERDIRMFETEKERVLRYERKNNTRKRYLKYYLKITKDIAYCVRQEDTTGFANRLLIHAIDNVAKEYLVKVALRSGANNKNRALELASKYGLIDTVKVLLECGADVHSQNDMALGYASNYGFIEIVKLLLQYGANPRANDSYAVKVATPEIHRYLLAFLAEREKAGA